MVPIGGGSTKFVLCNRWIVYTKSRKQLLQRRYIAVLKFKLKHFMKKSKVLNKRRTYFPKCEILMNNNLIGLSFFPKTIIRVQKYELLLASLRSNCSLFSSTKNIKIKSDHRPYEHN